MGRPRKVKQEEELTEEQVWDVLQFAKHLNTMYPGVFTPELVNTQLKNLNLNPLSGTKEDIDSALADPKNSETQLTGYSEFFELADMLYKRQILYLGNMLSWDWTYECTNINKSEEYNSPSYKKDEKILYDFMDKFNIKREFRKVLRQLMRQEVFYSSFRDDSDDQYVLQELPREFCKITGTWERGLLFDFNMIYFISRPGVDINMYSNVFKKYHNRILDGKNNGYIPSKNLNVRTGEWVYWVQTSPEDNMWMWKFTPEIIAQVPFFSPLFPDLVLRPTLRNLQTNKYIIDASKLLIGYIGFNKDAKSGSYKDSLSLSPEVAGKFAQLIRTALASEINFGIAPFEKVESFEWETSNVNILDQYNRTTVGQGGTNTKLLYNTADKMNALETTNSIAIDEQVVQFIYPYFESFLDYYVNRKTKKYKFKFHLEGTEMPKNKEDRLNNALSLLDKGIVLDQKIAAAMGMSPPDFTRQLEMCKAKGFVNGLTPVQTSYTLSNNQNNGRPRKNVDDLADSGETTRNAGSNVERGGDI